TFASSQPVGPAPYVMLAVRPDTTVVSEELTPTVAFAGSPPPLGAEKDTAPIWSVSPPPADTGVTVITALSDAPPVVALTVVVPAATPVTSPLVSTRAICVFALDHVTGAPGMMTSVGLKTVSTSCTVAPTARVSVCGPTWTAPIG